MNPLLNFMRRSLSKAIETTNDAAEIAIEKVDETLTPNMRALRLTMGVADQLLSMGTPAHSVVHIALSITDTYCKRKVHIDVSFTQIILSQDRGIDKEPLTLIRTITPRDTNYQTMRCLQTLAKNIKDHKITLSDAEIELDSIIANNKKYPRIVNYIAGGGLSAGSAALYTTSMPIIFASFGIGFLIAFLLDRLGRIALPPFFIQIIAALSATLISTGILWLVKNNYITFLASIDPTILTVGGIVLLVAGMMIVGALQDAIDEYYVTASARLIKVTMMTMGIVLGVGMGLHIAKQVGLSFVATPDRLSFSSTTYQYIGAILMSASFALGNNARPFGIMTTGASGLLGYYTLLAMSELGVMTIPANAVAGFVIGFVATIVSRAVQIPSQAVVNAGIVPLVPGLILYNGLMALVADPNSPSGTLLLLRAIMIAVAIAAGASFGVLIGRPTRRSFVLLRNSLPERPLHNSRQAVKLRPPR